MGWFVIAGEMIVKHADVAISAVFLMASLVALGAAAFGGRHE